MHFSSIVRNVVNLGLVGRWSYVLADRYDYVAFADAVRAALRGIHVALEDSVDLGVGAWAIWRDGRYRQGGRREDSRSRHKEKRPLHDAVVLRLRFL